MIRLLLVLTGSAVGAIETMLSAHGAPRLDPLDLANARRS
jgi:hypothetical protein